LTICQWFDLKTTGTVCESFGLKTTQTISSGLASTPAVMVSSGFASKPTMMVFSSLASKLVATVFPGLVSKSVVGFLFEPQNQSGGRFSGLDLKTDSSGLVIYASKSPRWFLSLDPKMMWASVCWLRHKIDRGRSARDTHRDLAACFAWKQVWLGFPSEARRWVVHVAPSRRLRRRQVEDGRVDATDCIGPCYPTFVVFNVLCPRGIVVI
jgi:hypothetical protein